MIVCINLVYLVCNNNSRFYDKQFRSPKGASVADADGGVHQCLLQVYVLYLYICIYMSMDISAYVYISCIRLRIYLRIYVCVGRLYVCVFVFAYMCSNMRMWVLSYASVTNAFVVLCTST